MKGVIPAWFRAAVVVLAWSGAWGGTAFAQSDDDARAQAKVAFQHAVSEFDAGHYAEALKGFEEAMRLRPHPMVEVNIANCYDKLNKPEQAIEHFERFLASDAGSPEQRQEVGTALERLKQQLGKILLHVTPDGAEVVVDQDEPRHAPITEPLPLTSGKHALQVRMDGYKPVQKSLIVKGGTTLELTIALEAEGAAGTAPAPLPAEAQPEPASPAPEAQPPAPAETKAPEAAAAAAAAEPSERESSGPPPLAWITGGVGLALAAAGAVTGVLALKAKADFNRDKTERFDPTVTSISRLASYDAALSAAKRARGLGLATDLVLGGAVICAGITTYLLIRGSGSHESAPRASVSPSFAPGTAGVSVSGAF